MRSPCGLTGASTFFIAPPGDSRETEMKPTLYAHPFSSYCQKVLIALYENETPFESFGRGSLGG